MARISAELIGRIHSNRARGKAARLYLRQNIATFPLDVLAKLPHSTLKRIGYEALTDVLAGPSSAPKKSMPGNAKATLAEPDAGLAKKPEHIPSLLERLILGIVLVAALTVAASATERHVRWLLYHAKLATGDQMGLCLRLDALTDDCSFEVKAGDLPIARIAELTGIPVATLAAANRNIPPSDPLPIGAHVRIKRMGDQHE